MSELRKIRQGASGYEAADIIYSNDTDLLSKIQDIDGELEANKAYVEMINASSGGTAPVAHVSQETGSSTTDVMSQAAVTNELAKINTDLGDVCKIADLEIPENLNPPQTNVVNAIYAQSAATDDKGHVLSSMYDDIQYLKSLEDKIQSLRDQITALTTRVEVLEEKVG
jgi:vacuolar-type H+-ATPase subunit D/Vma8